MRNPFSTWADAEAAADLDRAEGMLLFAVLAGVVPALVAGLLQALAGESAGPMDGGGLLAIFAASAAVVRWIGAGILTVAAPVYFALAVLQYRRSRGQSPELSGWALAEVYAACAVVAMLGLGWLA